MSGIMPPRAWPVISSGGWEYESEDELYLNPDFINISGTLANGVYGSLGPTGSGKDLIYAGLDKIPAWVNRIKFNFLLSMADAAVAGNRSMSIHARFNSYSQIQSRDYVVGTGDGNAVGTEIFSQTVGTTDWLPYDPTLTKVLELKYSGDATSMGAYLYLAGATRHVNGQRYA